MDSRAAAKIRAEVPLPVVTIALDATLDAIILRSGTKLVLYVNYNPLNTAALRSRSAIPVSLLHGDSDKIVSLSNHVHAHPHPSVPIALDATLDAITLRGGTKLVLYVNYNPLNTAALRSRSAIHVSLLHGDSDKIVSVSNQVKAYDYSFVAGQAAIDRLERY